MRAVAIGECMVELAPVAGGLLRPGFAGDTFNTAWHLRRALPEVWRVDYVTALGTDPLSDRMAAFMAAEGIGTGGIARIAGAACGLYLIHHENGDRRFAYWRGQSAARRLAEDPARLAAAVGEARVVYLSGITLAILPAEGREALLALLAARRAGGTVIAADPNYRPALWENAQAARDWIGRMARVADILLPSFDDEAALFADADPAATCARYPAPEVAVKDGPRAVTLRADGAVTRIAIPPASEIADTTGAGDAFNAGYLAARLGGAAPRDAVDAGAARARAVLAHPGAIAPSGAAR